MHYTSLDMRQSRLSHSETAVCFLPTFALSLADNNLTKYGNDMSGVISLAAALKDSKITHLKYGCPSISQSCTVLPWIWDRAGFHTF